MYAAEVQKLKQDSGFQSADVIQLHPNHEMREELRGKFLDEHVHSDDEIRFFVDGCGLFYMHFEEEVISVMCKRGDLIGIPAQTKHWFDMGPRTVFHLYPALYLSRWLGCQFYRQRRRSTVPTI